MVGRNHSLMWLSVHPYNLVQWTISVCIVCMNGRSIVIMSMYVCCEEEGCLVVTIVHHACITLKSTLKIDSFENRSACGFLSVTGEKIDRF